MGVATAYGITDHSCVSVGVRPSPRPWMIVGSCVREKLSKHPGLDSKVIRTNMLKEWRPTRTPK